MMKKEVVENFWIILHKMKNWGKTGVHLKQAPCKPA